jgi:hypothetical protein
MEVSASISCAVAMALPYYSGIIVVDVNHRQDRLQNELSVRVDSHGALVVMGG